ncbi:hypothetical protein SPH9361_03424 [Sphingobium sp. CECT 9361]|nr:hypothetical protein SPH9361_03424 [Sphingobium sp. CECT 9361]
MSHRITGTDSCIECGATPASHNLLCEACAPSYADPADECLCPVCQSDMAQIHPCLRTEQDRAGA